MGGRVCMYGSLELVSDFSMSLSVVAHYPAPYVEEEEEEEDQTILLLNREKICQYCIHMMDE